MQARIRAAWQVLRPRDCDAEFWVEDDSEGFGEYFRAWALLEECWRDGASIDDAIASIDSDDLRCAEDSQRILWIADLMGTLGTSNLRYAVASVSPILASLVFRQSMMTLDVSPYFGANSEYERIDRRRAAVRLGLAADATRDNLGAREAAVLLGLTEAEVETVWQKGPLGTGKRLFVSTAMNQSQPEEDLPMWLAAGRLGADRRSPVDALQHLMHDWPDDRECKFALGVFLALSGYAGEALKHLDGADRVADGDCPRWRDVVMRYFYVDCCTRLGKRPDRTFSDFIKLPGEQGFTEGLWRQEWDEAEYYLICRSWMVMDGKVEPFSSTATKESPLIPLLLAPLHITTQERDAALKSLMEQVLREQQGARTDIAAGFAALRADTATQQFLSEQLAQLMPPRKRASSLRRLRRIESWAEIPQRAKDQLVAAMYLTQDPALNAAEAVTPILLAVGVAVEITAKELLHLGSGTRRWTWFERLEAETNEPWVQKLRDVKDVRNLAAHALRALSRSDVDTAWALVLGDRSTPGLLDSIVQYARRRR